MHNFNANCKNADVEVSGRFNIQVKYLTIIPQARVLHELIANEEWSIST